MKNNTRTVLNLGIITMIFCSALALTMVNSPTSIVQSPQTIESIPDQEVQAAQTSYGSHLEFNRPGTYILAPHYSERYTTQSYDRTVYFTLVDRTDQDMSNFYDQYMTTIDGIYPTSQYISGTNQIGVDISPVISSVGVHTIVAQAHHIALNKWVNMTTSVNITSKYHCLDPYYESYSRTYNSGGYINWRVNFQSYYNYFLYVNSVLQYSYSGATWSDLNFDLSSMGIYSPGVYNVRLVISDYGGYQSVNAFDVTIASNSYPSLNQFTMNRQNANFFLWETQGAKLQVQASDSDNDLAKLNIYAVKYIQDRGDYPILYKSINSPVNGQTYEMPIDSFILANILGDNNNNNQVRFRALAVDTFGHASQNNYGDLYINMQNNYYHQYATVSETTIYPGRNIQTLSVTDPQTPSLTFGFTVVVDLTAQTDLSIRAMTASTWQQNGGNDGHPREPNGDLYEVFEGESIDGTWVSIGVLVWINVRDPSAVTYPFILKITYPESISPNPDLEDPPLRLLYWMSDWTVGQDAYWEQKAEEEVVNVEINAVEIHLNKFGFYGYGMDALDYQMGNQNNGVPGYPIGWILGILGLSVALVVKRRR